jgi:small subunit ribosomal protein S4
MGRYRGPRHRLSRREGVDLFGTGGEQLQRRLQQPPGQHGAARPRRKSEYALRLREKQKVKRIYGMREADFRRVFEPAQRAGGPTGPLLLQLLERRLDNVVYRLGLAESRPMARQLVNHGHVRVNGRRVDIPSALVEVDDLVELTEAARDIPAVRTVRERGVPPPDWLAPTEGGGRVVGLPQREHVDPSIREQLIVEFYSR